MSYRGAKVGHAFSSVQQVRPGRVALLQQPVWPHGQGVGLLIRRLPARVPQGVLGESNHSLGTENSIELQHHAMHQLIENNQVAMQQSIENPWHP